MPWILTEIFIRIDTARSDAEWQKDHKNPLSILFHCYRHGSVFMVCFVRFVLFSGALCATYTKLEFVCFCVFRSVYGCNMFACMLWFSFHWHILLGFGAYSISIILYSAIFNVFLMCIPHRLSKQMRLVSFFFHRTQFMRIYFVLNWTHLARIQWKTTFKSFSAYFFGRWSSFCFTSILQLSHELCSLCCIAVSVFQIMMSKWFLSGED